MTSRFSGRFTYIVVVPGRGSFETNSYLMYQQYVTRLQAAGVAYEVV